MSIYQRSSKPRPDSEFEPGALGHLVAGRRGRLLDARRTPISVVRIDPETGSFDVRIEAFEDRGAIWNVPFENVRHYQFEPGPAASKADITSFKQAITRFNQPFEIEVQAGARERTEARLATIRTEARAWLEKHSVFFRSDRKLPDPVTRLGHPLLFTDLREFMRAHGLEETEAQFARQFVSNPQSGEMIKGHRMVIAELGLVPFRGKVIRDPHLFDPPWERGRREAHILSRLAFVHEVMLGAGKRSLTLFRGLSTPDRLRPTENETFVSATFSIEVALGHFHAYESAGARALYGQEVPIERVFMTYLETEAMNQAFKEGEAVLLFDPENLAF